MAGVVVIGASHGGVEALRTLIAGLPRSFADPVLIVMHIGSAPSILPSILNDLGGNHTSHAVDGERIRAGHIYVAPPDHHMLVTDQHIRLSRGPRENWARPAIDPLFRSAASVFRHEAIGIILSGDLNDGTAGLYEIKTCGGLAIVQDPAEAEAPSMPRSALENVAVDYCVPVADVPGLLVKLTSKPEKRRTVQVGVPAMTQDQNFAIPVAQTCPECGGAMREERLGNLTQFRCHIGHVITAEILAAAKLAMLENDISACVRAMNERSELCREIARKYDSQGSTATAQRWHKAAEQARERSHVIAGFAEKEWIDPTNGAAPEEERTMLRAPR